MPVSYTHLDVYKRQTPYHPPLNTLLLHALFSFSLPLYPQGRLLTLTLLLSFKISFQVSRCLFYSAGLFLNVLFFVCSGQKLLTAFSLSLSLSRPCTQMCIRDRAYSDIYLRKCGVLCVSNVSSCVIYYCCLLYTSRCV